MRMILATAGLMLLWIFCAPLSAQPAELGLPKGALPQEIIGVGDNSKKAKASAIRKAEETIAELMEMHKPPLRLLKVNEEYIRRNVLAQREGQAGDDIPIEGQAPLKKWVLTMRSDRDWWSDIVRENRALEREKQAAFVTLGFSTLLLIGFGYLRLDDYTQRRYTRLLRAAGVGVAATAAAGWWWMVSGQ